MREPKGRRVRRLAVQRLEVHPNRFRWPERLARRLGRMPDRQVAALAGLSKYAVMEERRRRGIGAFRAQRRPTEWTDAMLRLLGTDTDVAVAAELGTTKQAVFRKRRILGIPSYATSTFRPPGVQWSRGALALLGTASDGKIARRLRVSRSTVQLKRLELGIPGFHPRNPPVEWSSRMLKLLGKTTDVEITRRFGMGKNTVRRKRAELGVLPPFRPRFLARTRALSEILKLPNQEVQKEHGIAWSTLGSLRRELRIPAPKVRDLRWTDDKLARLGKESDHTLAHAMGVHRWTVHYKRRALGIPPHHPKRHWTEAECRLLGRLPDAEVARRLDRTLIAVQLKRRLLGIARPRRREHERATAPWPAGRGAASASRAGSAGRRRGSHR